jgi:hypothetical protein
VTDPVKPGRRRRWRRLLIVSALLAALVLFHRPVFRGTAGLLVVEDPPAKTDAVVVAGCSGPFQTIPFDEVARLYHDGEVRAVVLIEDRSSRLVQAGIVPTLEAVMRRELAKRGVPESAFEVVAEGNRTGWSGARRLGAWLEAHPEATVTVLCDEFDSRRVAYVCRQVLSPEAMARVRFRALTDSRYGVNNWWRGRQGIVQFFSSTVVLSHTYLFGEPSGAEAWSPDAFESDLRALQAR